MSAAAAPQVSRQAMLSAVAYILQAAGLTVADLAAHVGQAHAAPAPVDPAPIHPPVRDALMRASGKHVLDPNAPLSDKARQIVAAAQAPHGITVQGVMAQFSLQEAQAHRYCSSLADAGHLIRVKKPGVRAMHFFASPADALAWSIGMAAPAAAAPAPAPMPQPAPRAQQPRAAAPAPAPAALAPAPEALPAPVVVPPPAEMGPRKGEPVFTPNTIRIIDTAPRPNARWQAAPDLPPDPRWPSFARSPLGVNPDTGKEWGQA